MCGRFSIHLADLSALSEALGVMRSGIEVWEPRFNVAPTQLAPVVHRVGGERVLDLGRFGLVPHWAESPAIGSRLINARIETVATKPAFRDAFRRHRCIVPATGYFEWKPEGSRRKQPMWLHPESEGDTGAESVWFLAGLWSRWHASPSAPQEKTQPDGQARHRTPIDSFCILTRPATGRVAAIHHRMPVVLPLALAGAWLDAADPQALLDPMLESSQDTTHVIATPVSPAVNSPRHDGPECIAGVTPTADGQLDLF